MKKLLFMTTVAVLSMLAACANAKTDNANDEAESEAVEEVADAQSGATHYSGKVRDLTMKKYNHYIFNTETNDGKFLGTHPIVIDFYATWCGPCKQLSPKLEALAKDFKGKIDFFRVDVDEETKLAQMFNIEAMPTLVYFDGNGNITGTSVGLLTTDELQANINKYCLKK